jgi:hypothetical protein
LLVCEYCDCTFVTIALVAATAAAPVHTQRQTDVQNDTILYTVTIVVQRRRRPGARPSRHRGVAFVAFLARKCSSIIRCSYESMYKYLNVSHSRVIYESMECERSEGRARFRNLARCRFTISWARGP